MSSLGRVILINGKQALRLPRGTIIRPGDRVMAAYQRYGYSFGNATVEGFCPSRWVYGPAAVVREDNGELSAWCWDRVQLVDIGPHWFEDGFGPGFEGHMRQVSERPVVEALGPHMSDPAEHVRAKHNLPKLRYDPLKSEFVEVPDAG